MRIDGRAIAAEIYDDLKKRVRELKKKDIIPHLAVIIVGDDPATLSYIKQKQKWAGEVNALVSVYRYTETVSENEIIEKLILLNHDPKTHGIIVQRPLPEHFNQKNIDNNIEAKKDIDGFLPDSPFVTPVAAAVVKLLFEVFKETYETKSDLKFGSSVSFNPSVSSDISDLFLEWLRGKNIAVIGKGKTGGNPTIQYLKNLKANLSVVDSLTQYPSAITKNADILILAVGKPKVVTPDMLKNGVILIGIGIHQNEEGKLQGDYDEETIENIASYYTPSPGGVGPVNVAMLISNLIFAAEKKQDYTSD